LPMSSIIIHPSWPRYSNYLRRQKDGSIRLQAPAIIARTAPFLRMRCVSCEAPIHPFQKRRVAGETFYPFFPTCKNPLCFFSSKHGAELLRVGRLIGR